jgi:hypothetical protein
MSMHSDDWPERVRVEASVLRAVLYALALGTDLPPHVAMDIPSLGEFVAAARRVADDIGWGDGAGDGQQSG